MTIVLSKISATNVGSNLMNAEKDLCYTLAPTVAVVVPAHTGDGDIRML